jgi:tetratricopeptide (TPR) repeat protein
MSLFIADPDWKLKDWRRFSRFEMDFRIEGDEPQSVSVRIHDDTGFGHGIVYLFNKSVQPGQDVHVAYPLNAGTLRGSKDAQARYFGGRFRSAEVAVLMVMVAKPTRPFTLYLDNLRLTPREAGAGTGAVVPAAPGIRASAAGPVPAKRDAAAARQHCEAAMAHKKAGRLQDAVREFQAAIAADPRCAEAYSGMAWAYVALGQNEKAVQAFEKTVELAPDTELGTEARKSLERLKQ